MSENSEKLPPFDCEGRGCKTKKIESLFMLNGFDKPATDKHNIWLCKECYQKHHGVDPEEKDQPE